MRHSPNLEVDDSDLQQYFSDLRSLLSDPGYLANDPDAQFAFRKLEQVCSEKFYNYNFKNILSYSTHLCQLYTLRKDLHARPCQADISKPNCRIDLKRF